MILWLTNNLIAILTETSVLVRSNTMEVARRQLVDHISYITVYHVKNNKLAHDTVTIVDGVVKELKSVQVFTGKVAGYINLNRRDHRCTFDLDDIFCVRDSHKTYFEFQLENVKISARDEALNKFITSRLKYSKPSRCAACI